MNTVYCNECKKDFIIEINTKQLEDNIERVYFTCPHCYTEYTAYYLDPAIKRKQKKMMKLQERYNKAKEQNLKNVMAAAVKQSLKLEKEIGRDMESLRKRIEAPNE